MQEVLIFGHVQNALPWKKLTLKNKLFLWKDAMMPLIFMLILCGMHYFMQPCLYSKSLPMSRRKYLPSNLIFPASVNDLT